MHLKKLFQLTTLVLAIVLSLSGCRTAKIYNVHDASIASLQEKPASHEDIRGAIIRAGNGLGWKMEPDREGHILGTLILRTHVAVVDITYTQTSYSIEYKDSTNLKYNGTNIHKNYNGWVQNLENAINAQINNLQY